MIPISGDSARKDRNTSIPSFPGILISVTRTSGHPVFLKASITSSPEAKAVTSWSSPARARSIASRAKLSSSTT